MLASKKRFYHHGKLLISGEYAILDGAKGFALPTKAGQRLDVEINKETSHLHWKSFDEKGDTWFEAEFKLPCLEIIRSSEKLTAYYLKNLLESTRNLSPGFLEKPQGLTLRAQLEFSPSWGLGSSSTLICNIAQWAKIDPYDLFWKIAQGSGYDIGCAVKKKPILYRVENKTPQISTVYFSPPFKDKLYFLYLNKKKKSSEAINFYKTKHISYSIIEEISFISEQLVKCLDINEFEKFLLAHEQILSKLLNLPSLKEEFFSNYKGTVKSLGAWGGDFALISHREGIKEYFSQKGFHTLIPFDEMILKI